MAGSDLKLKSMSFVLDTIMDELVEEMADKPGAILELYMDNIGIALSWIGHGNNQLLPEHMQQFAEMVQPTQIVTPAVTESDDIVIGEIVEESA